MGWWASRLWCPLLVRTCRYQRLQCHGLTLLLQVMVCWAKPWSTLFQWWWHSPLCGPDGWSRALCTGYRGKVDGRVYSDAHDWCGHVGTEGCGVMDLPCCFRLCSVELNLDLLYSSDDGTVPCVDQMAEVEHRVLVAEDGLMGESTLIPMTGADM